MKMDGWVRIGTMIDLDGLKKGLGKIKNTLSNVVSGLAKSLGGAFSVLLIGAVATGIFVLNKALEKLNGDSGQLKANLSYIGFVASKVFENLLTPAINKTAGAVDGLVNGLYKIVVYIGMILEALTGRNDLFEGTSVEDYASAMEKANKSASGTAKSTAKIKKDLMSFDEVNKLSDDTSGGSSGGGGITMPNLPNLGEIKKPWWIEWIEDHRETIIKIAEAIGGMFLIIKGLDLAQKLAPLLQLFGLGGGSTGGGLGGTLLLGSIATIVANVLIWRNAQKETAEWVDRTNQRGRQLNQDWIQDHKDMDDLQRGLNNKRIRFNELLTDGNKLTHFITGQHKIDRKLLQENLLIQGDYVKAMYEQYKNGELTEDQQEHLLQIIKENYKTTQNVSAELQDQGYDTKELTDLTKDYRVMLNDVKEDLGYNSTFLETDKMSWRELNDLAHNNSEEVKSNGNLLDNMTSKINNFVNKKKEEYNNQKRIKDMVDSVLQTTKAINDVDLKDKTFKVKVDKTSLKEVIGSLPNKINIGLGMSLDTSKIKKAFGLAHGGIINNPGRGVPLGTNIIGGEGMNAEAVIPLNDETMDRLGSSIAKHMSVNLTNINQMNGRVISRELKQISNENDFSYNG